MIIIISIVDNDNNNDNNNNNDNSSNNDTINSKSDNTMCLCSCIIIAMCLIMCVSTLPFWCGQGVRQAFIVRSCSHALQRVALLPPIVETLRGEEGGSKAIAS